MHALITLENQYGAHHYLPIPVVLVKGEGVYVWDDAGNQYIDMMSAYSAVSFGHAHPELVHALCAQAKTLSVVSRAFHSKSLAPFLKRVCEVTQQDKALPMNTGAEAVETAIKAARKWAYTVKGVQQNKAEIIGCNGNFHGRTVTIIGLSSEPQYKENFGPFPPGLKRIPFGDANALENAITENTAAFLVEPIQGEGGIIIPPKGYLKACQAICQKHNVLLICDEVQVGMGRTGKFLCSQHEGVIPDGLILGKALGGGLLPVSMFLGRADLLGVFQPGDHGSTFGGNELASVVGHAAIDLLFRENLSERSAELGDYLITQLHKCQSPVITDIRGRGLFVGVEINPAYATAREICLSMMAQGVLSKETHNTVVRFAPPLIITKAELDKVIAIFQQTIIAIEDSHK